MHNKISKIAHKWQKATDSNNTKINTQFLTEHVVPFEDINLSTTPWIFSHIPKTAGTAFEKHLSQAFELKDLLNVNAPDLNRLPQCIYLKNKYPKFITGHHPMHGMLYQLLPHQPLVHLTLLRDPITRTVSYYNYTTTRKYHALNSRIKHLSFDDFLKQDDLVELSNAQARRLAGTLHSPEKITDKDLYFKAKFSIDKCFSMVGVTEYFNDFITLLGKKCGVSFHALAPINKSEVKIRLKDLSNEQLTHIKDKNKVDTQLYEYVKTKFLSYN